MKKALKAMNILTLLLFLTTTACAPVSTEIKSGWVAADQKGVKLQNVLVIGVSENEMNRQAFEDGFVASLKSHGCNAVASYHMFPSAKKLNKEIVEAGVKGKNIDSVIVTRLIDKKKVEQFHPYNPVTTQDFFHTRYDRYHNEAQNQGVTTINTKVLLEINLYDAKTSKRIGSALSETIVKDSDNVEEIPGLIHVLIKGLAKKGLI